MEKLEQFLDAKKHFGILALRIFIGLRLFYGVIDNVLSWEHMRAFADFMAGHGFPFPIACAIVSVYTQFIGSLMILVGYKIRLASIFLIINFLVALLFVHIPNGDSVEGMTPALAMLFGCITFLFSGAERISLDRILRSKVAEEF